MEFLAGDELRGRGSGTQDEHRAAMFAAAQFEKLGMAPGGDGGGFVQRVALPEQFPDWVRQRLRRFEQVPRTETWNAVGILRGTASPEEAVLLTAHLDHLGVGLGSGDMIYNGADDDASGTTAVLALAKALAAGVRPRRTIVFALFGAEELGGYGSAGFLARPPVPLGEIVANLEFEMIGRADPLLRTDQVYLTGYERTNLGPELARHGAKLVADPHPAENFFTRSDNFALARMGIVAQTVSSYGLHKDYHRPSDELGGIDFAHLTEVITRMVEPVRWLAESDFRPQWSAGGRPK